MSDDVIPFEGIQIPTALFEALRIHQRTVTVRDPTPIAGLLEHAGIRITRQRGDAR